MANSGVDGRISHDGERGVDVMWSTIASMRQQLSDIHEMLTHWTLNADQQPRPLMVEDDSDSGDDGGYETYHLVGPTTNEYTTAWKNSSENVAENEAIVNGEIFAA
ncbi:hypothetical protein ACOSP7_031138 [Xanthoceras sorbifolium]